MRAVSNYFSKNLVLSISKQGSSILRPMERSKNGIILMRNTYENRNSSDDFDKFVNWYNSIRYRESLGEKHHLKTPEEAFWSRIPHEM